MAPSTVYEMASEEQPETDNSNVSADEQASAEDDPPGTGQAVASLPGISSTPTQNTAVQDTSNSSTHNLA